MKKPKSMVKIICECGYEILLLPDVKAMGKAIDDHVGVHFHNLKERSCTTVEAERLRDALIAQVLRLASQSEAENHE